MMIPIPLKKTHRAKLIPAISRSANGTTTALLIHPHSAARLNTHRVPELGELLQQDNPCEDGVESRDVMAVLTRPQARREAERETLQTQKEKSSEAKPSSVNGIQEDLRDGGRSAEGEEDNDPESKAAETDATSWGQRPEWQFDNDLFTPERKRVRLTRRKKREGRR